MNTATLKEIGTLDCHKNMVTCLKINEEGPQERLFSSSRDKKAYMWTLERTTDGIGKVMKEYDQHNFYVNSIVTNKTGDKLITACADSVVRIFDVETKDMKYLKGHSGDILCVAINSNDNKIVTGSMDKTICLWNTEGALVRRFGSGITNSQKGWITCIAFMPSNEDNILTGSTDGTLNVWDIETGEIIKTYINGSEIKPSYNEEKKRVPKTIKCAAAVTALSITPDGALCAYGSRDSEIFVFNLMNDGFTKIIKTDSAVTALAFALTDTILACATETEICLWDVINNNWLFKLDCSEYGKNVHCSSLVWSRNNLIAGFTNGKIIVYDCPRQ
ncbi:WD40 domain-containing protein [Hamiltosporidium tvaerminnensis]|uniref:WD40 domain-containing protein n=1 Tax=Hamiltosporidium tvaerminnensis TaxID=1176355 RepID=A0A4Q9LTR0_9MICR|nr:WD40 domain-containing protein [Hamiltosporidium tvaerminnensis]TBU13646.1 WD40 domain-containing protein [Hamiltosporidium tvaerminnensis]